MTSFLGFNIHAAEQWVAVKDEGNPDNFWDEAVPERGTKVAFIPDNEEVPEDINNEVVQPEMEQRILPWSATWDLRWTMTTNLLPKMSLLLMLPWPLMEGCMKANTGVGIVLIVR